MTTDGFTESIKVRLRPEDKEQIRLAARMAAKGSGRRGDLSDFVREAAIVAAAARLATGGSNG